jgi:hypothetical protein
MDTVDVSSNAAVESSGQETRQHERDVCTVTAAEKSARP